MVVTKEDDLRLTVPRVVDGQVGGVPPGVRPQSHRQVGQGTVVGVVDRVEHADLALLEDGQMEGQLGLVVRRPVRRREAETEADPDASVAGQADVNGVSGAELVGQEGRSTVQAAPVLACRTHTQTNTALN